MNDAFGIETRELDIGYREDLIRDISLKVMPGKILTLIGPNGCGKTTLLRTLAGILRSRGGVILLCGDDRKKLKSSEAAKRMSVVMTGRVRPELATCREVVETGRYPYTGRLGILSDKDLEQVMEAMELTDVSELEDELFDNLSDGQKQRVMLARAICQEPKILILDEPTSFLDIRHKLDILRMIKSFAAKKEVAVVMSLHELETARKVSDTVVAIGEGRVLKTGTPDEVFTEDFIRKLYDIEKMDTSLLGDMPWKSDDGKSTGSSDDTKVDIPAISGKKDRPHVIMIQGTMSNVGKSVITAGLCRIFSDDGYRVVPFKSQNMALNSCVTEDGLEIARAQVMQAECARIKPVPEMNPILLKPTKDSCSQVILNGRVVKNMTAKEYYEKRAEYAAEVKKAFDRVSEAADIVVVEGAGSPVEMNLKKDDIVNMGLAEMLDAHVLLVGDIDRGGVFAQLYGTMELLEENERKRVKGIIVNKFRGDIGLFQDGINILEEKCRTKVLGVVPFIPLQLDDEDSLSERFEENKVKDFDIAVIRCGHISNFTDLGPFEQIENVSVRYVSDPKDLKDPDLIVIPGTKNTTGDMKKLKESHLADAVVKKASQGLPVIGICGGFQMLGRSISDPHDTEGGGDVEGLCLLPVDTVLQEEKTRKNVSFKITGATGILSGMEGVEGVGYEIHSGKTTPFKELTPFTGGGSGYCQNNVYGTYIHGFFDKKDVIKEVVSRIAKAHGKKVDLTGIADREDFKESRYEALAGSLRQSLDMGYIYRIMGFDDDNRRTVFDKDR